VDFTFTPEADEAAALATDILGARVTPQRQRAVEAQGDRHDASLWADLASAGLLSLAVPESYGGAGLGLLEACRVLVEAGRVVAPVPAATHVAAALALAELGTDAQREAWLPGAADGSRLLSAATAEPLAEAPAVPSVTATPAGSGWRLDGTKVLVRAATHASALLVTAATPEGPGVFLVALPDSGASVEEQRTSDGDVVGRVTFGGAAAEAVGVDGGVDGEGTSYRRLLDLLTVTSCAELLGVTEGALRLTAAYATDREQFGRPIGTFQGVRHRLADGHIDVLAQRLTLWQAAWRLSEGLPAASEVATAKLWAADAAHRVAHTTVHVHGGVGIDLDGEAHRYFTAAKRWETAYGGATQQSLAVGRTLAGA
jgi:alkylation response protein AidB-like acyl-CoA dehydrogenase